MTHDSRLTTQVSETQQGLDRFMDCRKCGTWNPDDKNFCWRCGAELPKPVEKKPKKPARVLAGLPLWMWVVLVLFFAALVIGQCSVSSFLPS